MILSIDIETYGLFERRGKDDMRPLPRQTVFSPGLAKSDFGGQEPHPSVLVPQCAVTLVECGSDSSDLASWKPGPTQVLDLSVQHDRECLVHHLSKARTICGSNIPFDLAWLGHCGIGIPASAVLVDTVILSWMLDPGRRERSLKALAVDLGVASPRKVRLKDGDRLPHPMHPDAVSYNAADSHECVLVVRELARRAGGFHADDVAFHSVRLRNVVELLTSPVRIRQDRAEAELALWRDQSRKMESLLAALPKPVLMHGDGSRASQNRLLAECLSLASDRMSPAMRQAVPLTRSVRAVENSAHVRGLLRAHLPQGSWLSTALWMMDEWNASQACVAWLLQLLEPDPQRRRWPCLFEKGDVVAFPSWYPAPTDDGGTQTLRLSCRKPALQSVPERLHPLLMAPGHVSIDLRAFEPRVAAAMSGDRETISWWMRKDPYDDDDRDTRMGRACIKRATLVLLNGGSELQAAMSASVTAAAAGSYPCTVEMVQDLRIRRDPGIRRLHERILSMAREGDGLRVRGVRHPAPGAASFQELVSFAIQGEAAYAMTVVQDALRDAGFTACLQVHDQLVGDPGGLKGSEIRETVHAALCSVDPAWEKLRPDHCASILRRNEDGLGAGI